MVYLAAVQMANYLEMVNLRDAQYYTELMVLHMGKTAWPKQKVMQRVPMLSVVLAGSPLPPGRKRWVKRGQQERVGLAVALAGSPQQ